MTQKKYFVTAHLGFARKPNSESNEVKKDLWFLKNGWTYIDTHKQISKYTTPQNIF